jgi:catechol 2,3-dioxygenase-like lactoylglutathione lyase family enzyme
VSSIGIRHVHLLISDQPRAIAFYREAFGMQEQFREGVIAFVGTPGGGDSLALHLATTEAERGRVGELGGCEHFGIHIADRSAEGIDEAVRRVEKAGGRLLDRGEHAPGIGYAYVADPDGYVIEI